MLRYRRAIAIGMHLGSTYLQCKIGLARNVIYGSSLDDLHLGLVKIGTFPPILAVDFETSTSFYCKL